VIGNVRSRLNDQKPKSPLDSFVWGVDRMTHVTDEVSRGETMTREETGPAPSERFVDRIDPRVVRVLTVLGFGLPSSDTSGCWSATA